MSEEQPSEESQPTPEEEPEEAPQTESTSEPTPQDAESSGEDTSTNQLVQRTIGMVNSTFQVKDLDGTIIESDNLVRQRVAAKYLDDDMSLSHIHVPRNGQEFYDDFGHLPHPRLKDEKTGLPLEVKELAPYQLKAWGPKNVIIIKSNKTGFTTSFSLEDFQSRLLPEHAGHDLLLVAQNQKMANEHLLDLKKLVRQSLKYSQFMIERPDFELFQEEKSKLATMYIRNPFNPKRPSRIMALGGSEASAYSWKNVDWIHMSDVSQLTSKNQKLFFGALFSRLANTNGVAKIESIPGSKNGEVYRLWQLANGENLERFEDNADLAEDPFDMSSTFMSFKVTIDDGIQTGVITEEFKAKMKAILDDYTFRQLFMAEFVEDENQWYQEDWLKANDYGVGL